MSSGQASAERRRLIPRLASELNARRAPLALWLATSFVAAFALYGLLARTGGQPGVPLDDAYIHFQFARSFASLSPFEYTPGAEPTPGATSLLWPLLLVPCFWLGVDGAGVIWVAWALGFAALGLLALETAKAASQLLSPWVAFACGLMVPCFGGLVWLAGSGMEAVPFAWLWLASARRIAEYWTASAGTGDTTRLERELVALSYLTPLMRPEGSLVPVAAAFCFLLRSSLRGQLLRRALPQGQPASRRTAGLMIALAGAGALTRPVCFWVFTGQTSTTTSLVKWLPNNPYLSFPEVTAHILDNLRLLYGTLLNGEIWSASVLPQGSALVAWCAVPALLQRAHARQQSAQGIVLAVAALGLWIPCSFDTFLWNRLRYLWPFAPAWFIGVGALCETVSALGARLWHPLERSRVILAGLVNLALAGKLPVALDDLAESSWAINEQQVSLGHWATLHLSPKARIGVNDTGAIAYFSGRRTFDIVGLTTRGEGEHWIAGAGSRFEHYERMNRERLPTHFIVYPEWFALGPLLGRELTSRYVPASILGGTLMVAYEASYLSLGAAERPLDDTGRGIEVIDTLDVADLVSERAHDYALFEAEQPENRIATRAHWVDGERSGRNREHFELALGGAEYLVARLSAPAHCQLSVRLGDRELGELELQPSDWQEVRLPLPKTLPEGRVELELRGATRDCTFGALHYWTLKSK